MSDLTDQAREVIAQREAVPGQPSEGPYPASVEEVVDELAEFVRELDATCAPGVLARLAVQLTATGLAPSDDPREVRRGLEGALLGLQAMARLMDRLGELVVDWDTRAAVPQSRTADMWRLAVNELRAVVMLAKAPVSEARAHV